MEHWEIVSDPRKFTSLPGRDMDIGWAWDLARGADKKTVSVIVAGGRAGSGELPEDSQKALRTSGRSAVEAVLDRDVLPRYVVVTSGGLSEEAE